MIKSGCAVTRFASGLPVSEPAWSLLCLPALLSNVKLVARMQLIALCPASSRSLLTLWLLLLQAGGSHTAWLGHAPFHATTVPTPASASHYDVCRVSVGGRRGQCVGNSKGICTIAVCTVKGWRRAQQTTRESVSFFSFPFVRLSARHGQGTGQSRPQCFCNLLFCSSYSHTTVSSVDGIPAVIKRHCLR
jgi:hypothetical protein